MLRGDLEDRVVSVSSAGHRGSLASCTNLSNGPRAREGGDVVEPTFRAGGKPKSDGGRAEDLATSEKSGLRVMNCKSSSSSSFIRAVSARMCTASVGSLSAHGRASLLSKIL